MSDTGDYHAIKKENEDLKGLNKGLAHQLERRAEGRDPLTLHLRDEIDLLQTVLEPFAELDITHLVTSPDSRPLYGINATQITLGHVRAARAALAGEGEKPQ